MNLVDKIKNIGPGALVAAAFIGPGTVTTATVTGADYGYVLLWAMVFSIFSTIVLQEMSMRLGVISNEGLGEALRGEFENPLMKGLSIFLVVAAIGIGSAAFETGNILGGAMGLETITNISANIWGPIIGLVALVILWLGSYKVVERILVGLVIVMSISFIATAIIIRPNIGAIITGMFIPSIPEDGGLTMAVALIGTTVVPYNLFLHASSVQERWDKPEDLKEARFDTIFSIILGGAISMSIIVTAAATFHSTGVQIQDAGEMALQLEPLFGTWARWFFSIGLFAAGFSSAVTAPLAAAYATSGALGWEKDMDSKKFRAIWLLVLLVGIIGSSLGTSPIQVIVFAQAANGILLPISAIYLVWVMNNKDRLGEYVNTKFNNLLGTIVILVAIMLGARSLLSVFEALLG
ncbi:Nramp family divalent metal transporter [Natroniella acetigena]|uniref:Nramp family divalent metal transporter n=1 Tax=Natroniella acetigena TaxID=52004 RepID=UPI00200A6366|nr:Nramp family divalent metal transporter [Natroniella acetigena]MCK8827353.1 Nramp family divalent metal transporter [Natroniella acetigena]